ncbi:unnamed protein product, partial [Ectocarpus sp. 4 AP-2014]
DTELYDEFSRELLSPLLRLVPSALSSLDAVRLSSRVVVSLRENCVACLVRKEVVHDLAAALYRLLSKRDPLLKAEAFRVAEIVLAPPPSQRGAAGGVGMSRGSPLPTPESFAGQRGGGGDGGAAAAVSTVVSCSRAPILPAVSQRGGDAEQAAGCVWLDFRAVYARHGVTKLVEQYRADKLRGVGSGEGQLPSVAGDSAAAAAPASETTIAIVKRDGPAATAGFANGASTAATAAEEGAGLSSGVNSGA